jgi:hypothetical protein
MGYPVFRDIAPQLSVTAGGTNAEEGFGGLQPSEGIVVLPVSMGLVRSAVHVIVCKNGVLSFPHASINIHVRVCELSHPTVLIGLVIGYPDLRIGIPQLSVAVGVMNAEDGFGGLQPRSGIAAIPVTTGLV